MWGLRIRFKQPEIAFQPFLLAGDSGSTLPSTTHTIRMVGGCHSLFLSRKSTPIAAPTFPRMLRFQTKDFFLLSLSLSLSRGGGEKGTLETRQDNATTHDGVTLLWRPLGVD